MVVKKHKIPRFQRPNYGRTRRSRIKDNWRAPRGIDNLQGHKWAYMGKLPSIGYRQPKAIRGFHPLGMPEVLVHNLKEMPKAKAKVVVRIAGGVGAKLRRTIHEQAAKIGVHVLN